MPRLLFFVPALLAALTTVSACVPTKAAPPPTDAPREVCVGVLAADERAKPLEPADLPVVTNGDESHTKVDMTTGYVLRENGYGLEFVPRAQALARVKAEPTRVIVTLEGVEEECRNGLMAHAFFRVPDGWAPKPFGLASASNEILWRELAYPWKQLFVAGFRKHALATVGFPSCSGPMPMTDAHLTAFVPVQSYAEGVRILEAMQ